MSYACSEVIEDDEQFNTTIEKDSSNPGGSISLIDEDASVQESDGKGGMGNDIAEYLKETDTKTTIRLAYYVMAIFAILLSIIIYVTCRPRKNSIPRLALNKIIDNEKQPIIEDNPTKRINMRSLK